MTKRVIVVGAGIIGASFAYHLSAAGADVRLLDSAPGAGGVATPNSWAWINASWGNAPAYVALRQASMSLWHDLDKTIAGLNVNWCGGLLWDLTEEQLLAFAAERNGQDYPVKVIRGADVLTCEPSLVAPPTLALHVPGEGSVEPTHAAQRLTAAAQRAGTDMLFNTPVKWLITDDAKVTGVMTDDGPIAADVVVLAAGATTPELLQPLGLTLALDSPPGLLVHSEPVGEMLNGLVMAPDIHVRQTAEGRLVAGSDYSGTVDVDDIDASAHKLFKSLQQFLRNGEHLRLAFHTLGFRPTPRDGVSAIGTVPGMDGLYLCATHSGITLAPVLGKLGAREILHGQRDPLLAAFAPDRLLT